MGMADGLRAALAPLAAQIEAAFVDGSMARRLKSKKALLTWHVDASGDLFLGFDLEPASDRMAPWSDFAMFLEAART
jgi:hypothetical protein